MKERTRQQVAKMGSKLHYRTYKVGKHWLVAGISSLALAGVLLGAGSTQAEATTDGTDAVNDQTSQPTTAGDTLNQQEVPLASSTTDSTTAESSGDKMKADTGQTTEPVETPTPETTANDGVPTGAVEEQAASTDDSDASEVADDVQTYNLGTASDDVVDATKAQAEQAYATTGQAQVITRMAADETPTTGLVTINLKTPDGHLIISEKDDNVPVDETFSTPVENVLVITQEQVDDLKARITEAKADNSGESSDTIPEISDDAAGRYEFVSASDDTTGVKLDGRELHAYINGAGIRDYVFTVTYKKVPVAVDHVYTDGSDATGNTGKPTQIILSVDDPVDSTTTNKESLTVTFGDDDQATVTTSKNADTDAGQYLLSELLGNDGLQTISNASIQENLRSVGIRMDGTVDEANENLAPDISKVTFVYDKNATATTTPVTDLNQEMLDKLKDFVDQAMTDFGNDAHEKDKETTGAEGPATPLTLSKDDDEPQVNVGVALYVQNTETGEMTPFMVTNEPTDKDLPVVYELIDEDDTLPLDTSFSYNGVNYRYVGYEIAPTEGKVDGSQLNPNDSVPISTLVTGVDDNGKTTKDAPTVLLNAVYKVVPAETTANYVYDDADQTKVEPTQTVTTDQDSDITLPTTNLEKIVLTSNSIRNGVSTTLTLKFNSDFTVTHLILNEGTKDEVVLPAAYETLGSFLANNADSDLAQATLDGLASDGIDENATSPDAYQGFLAKLAKAGIHINGNVAIVDPDIISQLSDVTYVYAAPEKQPGTPVIDGGPATPVNPDVTQPTTDQPTVTPDAEQPTVAEPGGETELETEQPEATEQPAAGVKTDGDNGKTPETIAVSSNGTAKGNVETTGQAMDNQSNDSQTVKTDAQQLPQTNERDGQTGSVMGLVLASMLSLLGLGSLRKKQD